MASLFTDENKSRAQELIEGVEQIFARRRREDLEISRQITILKELILPVQWGECPDCEILGGKSF